MARPPARGARRRRWPRVVNHEWWTTHTFAAVGTPDAETVHRLSDGRLGEAVAAAGQPPRGRERRHRHRRPGAAPRGGGGVLGRREVPVPWACPARSSSTSPTGWGRSSRAPRSSGQPGITRCGPRPRRRRARRRTPCASRSWSTPGRGELEAAAPAPPSVGRRLPTWPPSRTSSASIGRAAGAVAGGARYDDLWTGAKGFCCRARGWPTAARSCPRPAHRPGSRRCTPALDEPRLPLPRLLLAPGTSTRPPWWRRARPLDPPLRRRHLGLGVEGERPCAHVVLATGIPEAVTHRQPRLPGPGDGRSRRLGVRPRRPRRSRDAGEVPTASPLTNLQQARAVPPSVFCWRKGRRWRVRGPPRLRCNLQRTTRSYLPLLLEELWS